MLSDLQINADSSVSHCSVWIHTQPGIEAAETVCQRWNFTFTIFLNFNTRQLQSFTCSFGLSLMHCQCQLSAFQVKNVWRAEHFWYLISFPTSFCFNNEQGLKTITHFPVLLFYLLCFLCLKVVVCVHSGRRFTLRTPVLPTPVSGVRRLVVRAERQEVTETQHKKKSRM